MILQKAPIKYVHKKQALFSNFITFKSYIPLISNIASLHLYLKSKYRSIKFHIRNTIMKSKYTAMLVIKSLNDKIVLS